MIGVGERAGSGMSKTFNGWERAGHGGPPYTIEHGPDRTTLAPPLRDSPGDSSIGQSDWANQADGTGGTEARMTAAVDRLAAHGASSRCVIAEAAGLKKSRTGKPLPEMVDSGAAIAEGATRDRRLRLEDGR